MQKAEFFTHDGAALAFRKRDGRAPTIVWLGGYRSDMTGAKASALDEACEAEGRAFLRFDYSGHGESGGAFLDGSISRWTDESAALIAANAPGPRVIVGSSMGAWIALRLALRWREAGRPAAGLVLIAPAPDFVTESVRPAMTESQRGDLAAKGWFEMPAAPGEMPAVYSRALIEDGESARVLTGPLSLGCPVRILQGSGDAVVPVSHALKLAAHLPADDLTFSLIAGGDHRLSRPEDIAMLVEAVRAMAERTAA